MAVKFGFGIIGTGGIFPQHAAALHVLRKRARLIGLADLDADRLRIATDKHFAPHAYEDHRRLLDRKDIDVISIATPPATHERLIIDCLQAGKAVICEKPLAHTLEVADRIIEAAEKYPGKLGIVYQMRYTPEARKVIWMRDRGWLGDLRYGRWSTLWRFEGAPEGKSGWWGQWSVAGGGVVMTKFIHELDQIIYFFGKPVEVCACMDTLQQQIESEDTFAATIRFQNGAIVSCSGTINAQHGTTAWDVVGDKASVHFPWELRSRDADSQQQMVQAVNEAFPQPAQSRRSSLPVRVMRRILGKKRASGRARGYGRGMHAQCFAEYLDAIESQGDVPVSAREARLSLDLCVGIYTSAITGKTVSLPLNESDAFYRGIKVDDYRKRQVS